MSKIITTNLTGELKNRILKEIDKLECGITPESLDGLQEDINIKYIEGDGRILAFCIYSNIIKSKLFQDLGESCDHYDDETYEYYEDFIRNMSCDTIYIHYIEAIEKGFGYGEELVDSVIALNKEIILYSIMEAEDFWRKKDFDNIFGYEYMYYIEK